MGAVKDRKTQGHDEGLDSLLTTGSGHWIIER